MANSQQQAALARKITYVVAIVVLFTVGTFGLRGLDSPLLGAAPSWTVSAQAKDMELRELDQGAAELSSSAIRLVLTGSRGAAVCVLWVTAMEKQKKHDWNEVELIVRSIMKLQPHFITPWLYQSWNLSYNVSVESDRVKDKYFYISRGIELLAEGERVNRGRQTDRNDDGKLLDRGSPDMRFWVGFYYQNKFGVSDEATTLRTLLQLSCIPVADRDPAFLRPTPSDGSAPVVNLERFEKFCTEHPSIVRRLREAPTYTKVVARYDTPDAIVDFLSENRKIPCRYYDPEQDADLFGGVPGQLKQPGQQFPVVPPKQEGVDPPEAYPEQDFADEFDNYAAGRAWFTFSQRPLPPPEDIPGPLQPNFDRTKYRMPRSPAMVIFKQYPARAQSYIAERLQKEGWYDASGWEIDRFRSGNERWFLPKVIVGTGKEWSKEAWATAHQLWKRHGERHGVYLDPTVRVRLDAARQEFIKLYPPEQLSPDRAVTEFPPEHRELFIQFKRIRYYEQNHSFTNFNHFYYGSAVEMKEETVQARKTFFLAERLRKMAEQDAAIKTFEQAFDMWKKLVAKPEYVEFRNDAQIQEDVYEHQMKYIDLLLDNEDRNTAYHTSQTVADVLAQGLLPLSGAFVPVGVDVGYLRSQAPIRAQRLLPVGLRGPLDGNAPDGQPWVKANVAEQVQRRMAGMKPQQPNTAAPAGPAPVAPPTERKPVTP